jgi:hypothetical protein
MPERKPRLARRLPALLIVALGDERTHSQDISFSGLFVQCARPRRPGELIPVRVTLPGAAPVALLCVVARVTPEGENGRVGIGLRLYQPRTEDARAWADLVDRIEQVWEGLGRPPAFSPTMSDLPAQPRHADRNAWRTFLLRVRSIDRLEEIYERDLATGSLFLRTPVPPAVGVLVQAVVVHPQSDDRFAIDGEVVRSQGQGELSERGFLLRLVGLDEDDRDAFRQFVQTGISSRPPRPEARP